MPGADPGVPTSGPVLSTPTHSPTASLPTVAPEPVEPPPPAFMTSELRPGILPEAYLDDACEFLRLRWDPQGSLPGTVVLPIMYHSVRDPSQMPNDSTTVSTDYLVATFQRAEALGFSTITTSELFAFLDHNGRIPPRSMILIIDDRYEGVVRDYFLPIAESKDWTVTLAWPIGDTRPSLWERMEALAQSGRLDVQSHGFRHLYITPEWSEAEMREEIAGGISVLEEHFGRLPEAFVWPGGNFTRRSVEIAREEGFLLGFTANSRGPLLFNWIPLGEAERAAGDPLMVLPRAWSTAAIVNLEEAARIGDEAFGHAVAGFPAEAEWFRQSCGGELGLPAEVQDALDGSEGMD